METLNWKKRTLINHSCDRSTSAPTATTVLSSATSVTRSSSGRSQCRNTSGASTASSMPSYQSPSHPQSGEGACPFLSRTRLGASSSTRRRLRKEVQEWVAAITHRHRHHHPCQCNLNRCLFFLSTSFYQLSPSHFLHSRQRLM